MFYIRTTTERARRFFLGKGGGEREREREREREMFRRRESMLEIEKTKILTNQLNSRIKKIESPNLMKL